METNTTTRIIKYIVFFIILYIITKYIIGPTIPDNTVLIISALGTVTFSVLDLLYPAIIIEKTQ